MQPRVTAILVARNGATYLGQTLGALRNQVRRPDALITVDAGSRDESATLLKDAQPTQAMTVSARASFGTAVGFAAKSALPPPVEDDWLWLLGADNVPEPGALAALLHAVEVAPSVGIAGPKLMRADESDIIARYGESMTRYGASVILVENELDQAQYDSQSDYLGVAAAGMLVRRSVWEALGGFDPGLPSVDAGLDFSIRARLAGHRVIGVPSARIASAGGPELFGRTSVPARTTARIRRRAQLHRRMVYARGLAPLFLWLSLVPIAVLRCLLQLLRKQPGFVGGELAAAFAAAFDGTVPAARARIRRTRRLGWGTLAPLRISRAVARERKVARPTAAEEANLPLRTRASFMSGGGAAVVLVAAVIGVLVFGRLLGASAVQGGALLPLSGTVPELWANVGYGWHWIGSGFVGASDPFAAVLAVLGSITFWSPSFSIVLLYLVALPMSALGAWWCATRLATRAWPAAIAALVWALAPPFLSSLERGQLGAALAHILLPWLALTVIAAARSWSAGAVAALLFAAVAASAPSLVPALVVLLVVWMIVNPTRIHRLVGIVIPAVALFLPLVYAQLRRGTPLALLADPGLPTAHAGPSRLQLLLGATDSGVNGWIGLQAAFGGSVAGSLIYAVLLLPLLVVALAAAFVRGSSRGIPALAIAVFGLLTAIGESSLSLTTSGSSAVTNWSGPGLSLMWLGLTAAMVVGLEAFGRAAALPALVVVLASAIAVAPLLVAPLAGSSRIAASTPDILPAYVDAVGANKPNIGTLVLTPQSNGSLGAVVQRGAGLTLDDQSTLAATSDPHGSARAAVLTLAGNLASRSGLDVTKTLDSQRIGFVLLRQARGGNAGSIHDRANEALNGNAALALVGTTNEGYLWRYSALPPDGLATANPSGGQLRSWILIAFCIVFGLTVLLAVPVRGARRRTSIATVTDERATLGEDDDA